jgi:guanylate kinase
VEVLIERLTARNTESEESLQKRIAKASLELSYRDKFDQTVLNDNLEKACAETLALVRNFIK